MRQAKSADKGLCGPLRRFVETVRADETRRGGLVDIQSGTASTVEITQRALADLERLFDFIATEKPQRTREQILSVRKAFELPADHPLLGRSAEEGRRQLILSRGRYGYIAKYRWLPAEDIVLILAVRHQLEAGYAGE